jgi:hypothetical protein
VPGSKGFVTGHDLSRAANAFQIEAGFTGCGKTHAGSHFKRFVTGHDFSRADKVNQINVGL